MTNYCSQCGKPTTQGADFCTHCGASLTGKKPAHSNWENKRERVLGKVQTQRRIRLKPLALVGVAALAVVWVYMSMPDKGNQILKAQPVVLAATKYPASGQQMFDIPARVVEGKIVIPLEVVRERKFVAFNYTTPTNVVPLLAYVSGEGKIVTAVSMCEPCNSKRFHMKGDKLICNSCGTTWEVDNLEAVSGSCGKYPPDALPNIVVGDQIQIDAQTVATWQRRV